MIVTYCSPFAAVYQNILTQKKKTEKTELNLNPNHSQTKQTNKKERNKEKTRNM